MSKAAKQIKEQEAEDAIRRTNEECEAEELTRLSVAKLAGMTNEEIDAL